MIGHATLAAGHLVLEDIRPGAAPCASSAATANSRVSRNRDALSLEMPALRPHPIEAPAALARGLGARPSEVLAAKHYLCVFDHADEVTKLAPDMMTIARLDLPAVIVTAPGTGDADFVSRFFAPANGVPEDPVSGVAHLCLAPDWSRRLGKKSLVGRQLSPRGGTVRCGGSRLASQARRQRLRLSPRPDQDLTRSLGSYRRAARFLLGRRRCRALGRCLRAFAPPAAEQVPKPPRAPSMNR